MITLWGHNVTTLVVWYALCLLWLVAFFYVMVARPLDARPGSSFAAVGLAIVAGSATLGVFYLIGALK